MSWFVTLWAIFAGGFTWVAVYRLLRAGRASQNRKVRVRRRPHVLLLRPVDAPTPLELQNLDARIDYSGELTHVVLSPYRPRLQSANVRWLPSDPLSSNRKVGHVAYALAALPEARDAVVLCVDADVKVDGALVSALVEQLQDGAALASAPPRPEVIDSFAGRVARGLLVQSHHSFEALDVMSAGAKAICGKAIALSPAAAGELVRLADCIGEDLELSQVLHDKGLPVSMASAPAHVPQARGAGLKPVIERFTRWMQVLRAHRPALFPSVPLFFAPTPVLMVLASIVATPQVAFALCFLVAARITLANKLDRRAGLRFEWLLAEGVLLGCWLESLRVGRMVSWRGRRFELRAGGKMEPVPE